MKIPFAPLTLGLAGLIPFIWGGVTVVFPELAILGVDTIGARFVGPYVQLFYGAIILSFMSGVLWGFATQSDNPWNYVLSVLPALWAFFMTGGGPTAAAMNLIAGFLGLILIDWAMFRQDLTPQWWMPLRVGLTVIVVLSLLTVVI